MSRTELEALEDFGWVADAVGGRVVSVERQAARRHGGRPAWFVDVERDGTRLKCYARMQRPEIRDGGDALQREGRVLDALAEAGVRVPRVYGFSSDPLGLLIECLPGTGEYIEICDETQRRALDREFVAELVKLHSIDIQPFAALGMPIPSTAEEYVTLDLDGWERTYRTAAPVPLLEFACAWLRRNIPEPPSQPAVLQGDTGPGQYMFDGDRLTGIVDWELAQIGDPMLDLALVRGRDFYNPGADLREWFATYEELSGTAIDWSKLSYYTVKAMVITPLALTPLCQNMFVETDHAEWYAEVATYGRATAEALAEAVGVPLDDVAIPVAVPGRLAPMFAILDETMSGDLMPADDYGRYRMGLARRLVRYLKNADALDDALVGAELDDMASVLGARPSDMADGDRRMFELIADQDPGRDADLIRYLYRRAIREEALLRGALGAGEHAVLIPLDQLH